MRFEEAAQVIAQTRTRPGSLGVCFGCGGIVRVKAVRCPACEGYRFTQDPEAVVAQAMLLGTREPVSVLKGDLAG